MEAGAIAVEGGPNGTVVTRAWATTPRPTWSTASPSRTRCWPRRARRLGDGHQWCAQSHTDRAGAGL